jgi:threonine aldolase
MSVPAIDLRSDTLSPSTPAMFEALAGTTVGMASRGEDDNVNRIEAVGARILGTESCAFLPNVTSANLHALMAQAPRGTAVLMDRTSHINEVEWYGVTAIGGAIPWTLQSTRGSLDPAHVEAAFLDRNDGRTPAISTLVLENTHNFAGGVAISVAETSALSAVAHAFGAAVHLDGARLPNAAVALGVSIADLAAPVDTVALSLTKGLCAPFGGLLGGPAGVIDVVRHLAHQIGFGRLHKAGYFAAAGLVALDTMADRVIEDHRRARMLGEALARLPTLDVDLETVQTNIVIARLTREPADSWSAAADLARRGVGLLPLSGGRLRAVVHRGIDDGDIAAAIRIIAATLD